MKTDTTSKKISSTVSAAAAHTLTQRPRTGIQRTAVLYSIAAPVSESVAQQQAAQFAITSNVNYAKPVDQSDQDKMTDVIRYLDASLAGINNTINDIAITVKDMGAMDPARTSLTNQGTQISIDLGIAFLKISSVGDITGMLAHEIGVHTLADAQMGWGEKSEEEQYQKNQFQVKVGLHTHKISPWDDQKKWGGRQQDHVNVVRDKGEHNQPPRRHVQGQPQFDGKGKSLAGSRAFDVDSVNNRAEQYAETMLRLGDAIEADNTIQQDEKDKRLHDLLNSFLFDYARMLATDDVAWHVADKTPLVAQVFNWYKDVIIARHSGAHQWLQRDTMLPTASTWGLRAYLLGKIAQTAGAKILRNSVYNATGSILNAGGNLLSGIGNTVADYTPDSVKDLAGSVAWGGEQVLRGADYVYGELENLVLPNVVAPLAWGAGKLGQGASWLGSWLPGRKQKTN
ncbi:MAG: hypothetical protein ACK5Z2_17340 [Bacteroidota bacterium]|jgi:hypothetical protein